MKNINIKIYVQPRKTGKTTELIDEAYDSFNTSECMTRIVTLNSEIKHHICEKFKLLENVVIYPIFRDFRVFQGIKEDTINLFIDEYLLFNEDQKRVINYFLKNTEKNVNIVIRSTPGQIFKKVDIELFKKVRTLLSTIDSDYCELISSQLDVFHLNNNLLTHPDAEIFIESNEFDLTLPEEVYYREKCGILFFEDIPKQSKMKEVNITVK